MKENGERGKKSENCLVLPYLNISLYFFLGGGHKKTLSFARRVAPPPPQYPGFAPLPSHF